MRRRQLGASVLLVPELDRLARDVMVAAMVNRLVEQAGAEVSSADGTGNGDGPKSRLIRGIRAVSHASQDASRPGREEREARENGRAVPFAYRLRPTACMSNVTRRSRLLSRAVHRLRRDDLSIRAIADRLNADGIPARGARWHATSVARLLEREST